MQNKPNLGRPGRGPQGNSAERSQFRQSAQAVTGEMRQTKPNLGKLRHLGDGRSSGPIVPNKANLSIADWRRTSDRAANCAKRTQFGLPPRGRGGRNVQNEPNSEEAGRRGDTQHSTIPVRRRPSARRGQAPVPALWKGNHRGLPLRALAAATHGRGLRGGAGGDLAGLWPRRSMTIMARGQDVQGPGGFHW
jgi:hypothetical protein